MTAGKPPWSATPWTASRRRRDADDRHTADGGEAVDNGHTAEAGEQGDAEYVDDEATPEDSPGAGRNGAPTPAESVAPLRPLGVQPLLDSEPLPATRPGLLRPRTADSPRGAEPRRSDGFSLPVQRPAFDIGADDPADVS